MTLGRERKRASSFCVSPKAILTASRGTQKEGFFLCGCWAASNREIERETKMRNTMMMALMSTMFVVTGCGKQDRIEMAESNAKGGCNAICSVSGSLVSWQVFGGKADLLYYEMVYENGYDYLEIKANPSSTRGMSPEEASERYRSGWFISQDREDNRIYTADFKDYAFNKRNAALIVARTGFTYQFGNYYHLDGVSGLIYNVAYLFSIPRKILTYWKCADGITGYLWGVLMLLFGGLCSIVGCVLATVVNTLCHPIETLANLTVGVVYFDHWFTCLIRTNIVASLWDLIWGGIIYPLVKAVLFFM